MTPFEPLRRVLSLLENPHLGRKVLQVAGTKGKGSVVHFADAILSAHGVRTMRTTSPHLNDPCERITLDGGTPIAPADLEAHLATVKRAAKACAHEPSFFESITIAAWLEARRKKVDVDLLEVGMGGRLDPTNVCEPAVSVITSIGLDHQKWLGQTREAIAREKAGILKPGVPVVTLPEVASDPASGVIHSEARRLSCPVFEVSPPPASAIQIQFNEEEGLFCSQPITLEGSGPALELRVSGGLAALQNAGLALVACRLLMNAHSTSKKRPFDAATALHALQSCRIPGRMQWVPGSPPILLDGAHTPESVRSLLEAVDQIDAARVRVATASGGSPGETSTRAKVFVLALSHERDPASVFSALLQRLGSDVQCQVICVGIPDSPAAGLASRLQALLPKARAAGIMAIENAEEGFQEARKRLCHAPGPGSNGWVVACGSFKHLGQHPAQPRMP